ncbi:hypothetical protein CRG98_032788 [Punica granatum]|uniref:Uncharacterized protein n=1 Tax=Punica granatum TaxID=22663 RepID=A0A2I0IT97_PUNGR|nr:hypothetical protein CRG98_032788 [Punica granatum]
MQKVPEIPHRSRRATRESERRVISGLAEADSSNVIHGWLTGLSKGRDPPRRNNPILLLLLLGELCLPPRKGHPRLSLSPMTRRLRAKSHCNLLGGPELADSLPNARRAFSVYRVHQLFRPLNDYFDGLLPSLLYLSL